ncbi:lipase maturation factor family protein [Myxococcus sp. K38C18041901]|uniref:lipase maturation factor family protein n=1 Tax=Myxococcus guangdongensis TaxID=2906760 RepID=UPI0020A71A57|nr:lipase maturation factor family protein [Myxococcus guangdongensis]MCP3059123.1 lipase maturation factor family protein [Myxococcus guangdongensis]
MVGSHTLDQQPSLLLYDADCGFCRRWVARWKQRSDGSVRFVPGRSWLLLLLGIPRRNMRRATQLVEPSGRVTQGAEAVFRALARSPRWLTRGMAKLGLLPGMLGMSQVVYGVIARNRRAASRVDRWLFGSTVVPRDDRWVRWLFLRLTGGVFLIAFTSLRPQVLGLFGARGIRPVKDLVGSALREQPALERWRQLPTVFWFDASDAALVRGCRAGQLLSLAVIFDVAPRSALALLWGLYLSYAAVGREFLSFQWDVLLLEMGLLSALTAPPGVRPGLGRASPTSLEVFLFRLLVFRLYFGSGLSKWQSGDRTWRELTACRHYYETAPLPTRGGWYAHHLPMSLQRASTAAVLAMEVALPPLVFAPRRPRQLALGAFSALQLAIMATGNYGFFNVQSLVLGLWLLDDASLRRMVPSLREPPLPSRSREGWSKVLAGPLLVLGAADILLRFERSARLPERVQRSLSWLRGCARPLRAVNRYGLFSVMTVERPEIVVEGSRDGAHWEPYGFRYKVDDVTQPPAQVAPHQPRLDWQMWFAALGSPPSWFVMFLARLLEGSPEVLSLLARNPFPDAPPRQVRAVLYDYRMTDLEERRRTGAWWMRERRGLYVQPLALAPGGPAPGGVPRLRWLAPDTA